MIQKTNIDGYSVIGYDKDNDVFICYDTCNTLELAVEQGRQLFKLIEKGELRREDNGEPIDWVEVYWNWNKDDERLLWGSYNDSEE